MTNHAPRGALSGLRVLDFSRVIAGPFCTMQLADMGAEIIKVEHPQTGDDTRAWKPPEAGGESYFYLALNRTKRGIALDIASDEGRAIARDMAMKSDVVIENFRPGVMGRLGLDYDQLKALNPRLIYCSVSAYGQAGPMADRPGFDPVLQAELGWMAMNGEPGAEALRLPVAVIDTFTALYAASSILAAVIARGATGHGQRIELSLMGVGLATLAAQAQYALIAGQTMPRTGNNHPIAVPVGLFPTRGGPIYAAPANDKLFEAFCREVLREPELVADPRFRDNAARMQNAKAIYDHVTGSLARLDRDEVLARARKAGLPVGAVRDLTEALEAPEIKAAGLVATVDHPTAGALRMVGSPIGMSETPVRQPTPPPRLGEHTDQVLTDLLI
ncbi:MAG: CoA transferase [Alphaproteobacteria bacterium]